MSIIRNVRYTKCPLYEMSVYEMSVYEMSANPSRDPKGRTITFLKCETLMYRTRRQLQPKILTTENTSFELESILQGTPYELFTKYFVTVGDNQAFFFSDVTMTILAEISDISFDGTFYTVPKQFYQLWTIYIVVDQHVIPAIHCLLIGKSQGYMRLFYSK